MLNYTDNFKKISIYSIFIAAASAAVIFAAGCTDKTSNQEPSNYLFYERYGAPEVITYIEKYGNDYEKTQFIEDGKVYETIIWRTKGVSIKYLQSTGQIVKVENFSALSTQRQ